MDCQRLVFSSHAVRRMFSRQISQDEVKQVIAYGETIENEDNNYAVCDL